MKRPFSIILLLINYFCFGQYSRTTFSYDYNDFQEWTYQDFLKNNVKKIEAYYFKFKKNGKISKDSVLAYKQQLEKSNNKVFGVNCYTVFQDHGPNYLSWYKFETFYNNKNQVIKDVSEPILIEKERKFGSLSYELIKDENLYEYDINDHLTKKTYNHIVDYYSIFLLDKDTFHSHSIKPKVYENIYNEKGQEIADYYTDDSTRYLPTKSYKPDSISAYCFSCSPRYLNGKKEYYDNGKLKIWTLYTYHNEVHTKKYYYYDNSLNLIKIVDSTGWYFKTSPPSLESTTYYTYNGTTLIEMIKLRDNVKTTERYDSLSNIIGICMKIDSTETCTHNTYIYKNNKISSIISINNNINKTEIYLTYNSKGLLFEKRVLYNSKLNHLERYYYE